MSGAAETPRRALDFSAVFRFSIYGIEPHWAATRFGSYIESVLANAARHGWTLTALSHQAISPPFGYTASFAIRKSFATAAWAETPFEAILGALWIAHAHADWLDANPQPSRHASRDPRLPENGGRSISSPASPVTSRHKGRGVPKLSAAEKAALLADLFGDS